MHTPTEGLERALRDALLFPSMETALTYVMGYQHAFRWPCVAAYRKTLTGKSIVIPRDGDLLLGIRNAGARDVTGTLTIGGGWSDRVVLPADRQEHVPPLGGVYPLPLTTLQFHDARLDLDRDDAAVEVLYGALDSETRRALATNVVVGELQDIVMSTAYGARRQPVTLSVGGVRLPRMPDASPVAVTPLHR